MEVLNELDKYCRDICKSGKSVLELVQSGEIDNEDVKGGSNAQIHELNKLMVDIKQLSLNLCNSEEEKKNEEMMKIKTTVERCRGMEEEFVELVTACCGNPYDFSLQQNLQIIYAKMLSTFNEVINSIEKVKGGQTSLSADELLQLSSKNAVFTIRNLAELLNKEERFIEEFSKVARECFEALISLKTVVSSYASIPPDLVEKFGRLTPLLIKCAKEAFMKPSDLESKKNFDLMKQGIAKFIHQFLSFSIPSDTSSSPSPLSSPTNSDKSDYSDRSDPLPRQSSDHYHHGKSSSSLISPPPSSSSSNSNSSSLSSTNNIQRNFSSSNMKVSKSNSDASPLTSDTLSNALPNSSSHSSTSSSSSSSSSRRVTREERKEKKKKKEKEFTKVDHHSLSSHEKKKKRRETINLGMKDDENNNEYDRHPINPAFSSFDKIKKKFAASPSVSSVGNNSGNASRSYSMISASTISSESPSSSQSSSQSLTQSSDNLTNDKTPRPIAQTGGQMKRTRPQSRHDIGPIKSHSSISSNPNLRSDINGDSSSNNNNNNNQSSILTQSNSILMFFMKKFPLLENEFSSFSIADQNALKKELNHLMLIAGLEDSFLHTYPILSNPNDNVRSFEIIKKFGLSITRLLAISYSLMREAECSTDTSELEGQFHDTFLAVIDNLLSLVKSGSSHLLLLPALKEIHDDVVDTIRKIKTTNLDVTMDDPVLQSCKKHNIGLIDGLIRQTLFYRTFGVRSLSSQLISTITKISSSKQISQNTSIDLNSISLSLSSHLSIYYTIVKLSLETAKLKITNQFPNQSGGQEAVDELLDIDIWAYNKKRENNDNNIATLNHLIESLTSDVQYDANFMKTFICTYQSFTTPTQLLSKLKQRFFYPSSIAPQRGSAIQMRVCVVLKHWVQNVQINNKKEQQQFNDFDDNLVNSLFEFLENSVKKSGHPQLADIIIVQLLEKTRERQIELESKVNAPPVPLENFHLTCESFFDLIYKYPAKDIAQQMTLIDMNYFAAIQPTEFMKQAWNSNSSKWKAVNINQLMDRLNSISYWLSSIILSFDSVPARAKAMEWFYDIAINLRKLNNYHSVMGFVVGFNISGINRLKHTIDSVDRQLIKQFTAIEELMNPSSSFKNYRKQFNVMKLPAIPYLGVHLTDLVFIEDGNPDEIDGKINFPKRELVYKTISEIQVFQQSCYDFPVVEPLNRILQYLPCCTEKQLYKLSLFREPRSMEK